MVFHLHSFSSLFFIFICICIVYLCKCVRFLHVLLFSAGIAEQRPIQSKLTWLTKEQDDAAKKMGCFKENVWLATNWTNYSIASISKPSHCVLAIERFKLFFTEKKKFNALGNLKMYIRIEQYVYSIISYEVPDCKTFSNENVCALILLQQKWARSGK